MRINPLIKQCITTFFLLFLFGKTESASLAMTGAGQAINGIVFSCQLPEQTPLFKTLERRYQKAFAQIGYSFHMEHQPNLRSVHSANAGLVDGNCMRIKDYVGITGYNNLRRVDQVVGRLEFDIWTLAKNVTPTLTRRFNDNGHIGYIRGARVVEMALARLNNSELLVPINETLPGFEMLLLGRITHFIENNDRAEGALNQLAPPQRALIVNSGNYLTVDVYPYLHKKHQNILPGLEQALRSAQNNK